MGEEELAQLRKSFGVDPMELGEKGVVDLNGRTGLKIRQLVTKLMMNGVQLASEHYGIEEETMWQGVVLACKRPSTISNKEMK